MRLEVILTNLIVVMLTGITTAQMEGDQWVMGYWGSSGNEHSVMFIDFRSGNPQIVKHTELKIEIFETASNICSSKGDPLIWTNGMQIMDSTGGLTVDTIAYDGMNGYWDYFYLQSYQMPLGFPQLDGAIILPVPDNPNEFSVVYHYAEPHPTFFYAVTKFLEARIKFNQDTGFITKFMDVPIGPRLEWYTATISAVRHGNGRDWWLVSFREDSPEYYVHLLDPEGIHFDHVGAVDTIVLEGLGQTVFSALGNYCARMDATTLNEGEFITLYKFDRCDGDLERLGTFNIPAGYFTGVAFSPSERYLYADESRKLWQWDLWADNIAASQTLVDTFDGFEQPNWGPMAFGPMANGPDGRIYITPPAGSSQFLHVIDKPDLPAPECRFLQHAINLKIWNGRTAPNIPNYRLGPLDDSPCDTLGLNNLPVSRWRYEEEQPGYPDLIRFTDLSFFNPDSWQWDFDDGGISDIPSPLHSFEPGMYHVCLTVSNEYATDSSCQWVEILPTAVEDEREKSQPDISISPNPFHNYLWIQSRQNDFRSASMQIYDMFGRLIFDDPSAIIPSKVYFQDYSPGLYLCVIREEGGSPISFKLMKE